MPAGLGDLHDLTAENVANFCGRCHRTWAEVLVEEDRSINNIRFQPYRLWGSKCYDPDDARISCVACHDPHKEFSVQAADYDPKCQACHGSRTGNQSLSSVEKQLRLVPYAQDRIAGRPLQVLPIIAFAL